MPTEPPMACTLTATEMPQRLAEIRAVGQASLLSAETTKSEAVMRFRATGDTRQHLEAIVAAEAQCCTFLKLDLAGEAEDLVLTIHAPEGGEPVMDELVAAFRGEGPVAA